MSSNNSLALLLDGPMQAWGHASRFERRNTASHPTRSALLGIIAAALGIDKHSPDEAEQLSRFGLLGITTVKLDKHDQKGRDLPIQFLNDYHTVTGIRRASGKVDKTATVQTYRQYLLDARFAVLIDGPPPLLQEISLGLQNPRWGTWLGRKCCIPSSPLLVAPPGPLSEVWASVLQFAGYVGTETMEMFDHVIEVGHSEKGAESIEDVPIAFGNPIGERHTPRWVRRIPKESETNQ
ncbi:type I-E CRISPR-associated protein Cas5/CasD [bacterium]|jgi:CRISPR system Cascade subunit CasD|nr:type I-E CRISPR-associated protein Cas5/CasD [bacterium]MDB4796786.1 type I-E CRISPR-associated protein Cas5/CasD [bacterium]